MRLCEPPAPRKVKPRKEKLYIPRRYGYRQLMKLLK